MPHNTAHRIFCDSLIEFQKSLRDKEINVAILTWREEWAPAGEVPGQNHGEVTFGSLREIQVLGYHRSSGTIISLVLHGPDANRPVIREQLVNAGFKVSERCRNLT